MYTLHYIRTKQGKDVDFTMSARNMHSMLRHIRTLVLEADQADERVILRDIVQSDGLELHNIPAEIVAKAMQVVSTQLLVLGAAGWFDDEWFTLYDKAGRQWDLNLYTYGAEIGATIYPVKPSPTKAAIWVTDTSNFCTFFRMQINPQ